MDLTEIQMRLDEVDIKHEEAEYMLTKVKEGLQEIFQTLENLQDVLEETHFEIGIARKRFVGVSKNPNEKEMMINLAVKHFSEVERTHKELEEDYLTIYNSLEDLDIV